MLAPNEDEQPFECLIPEKEIKTPTSLNMRSKQFRIDDLASMRRDLIVNLYEKPCRSLSEMEVRRKCGMWTEEMLAFYLDDKRPDGMDMTSSLREYDTPDNFAEYEITDQTENGVGDKPSDQACNNHLTTANEILPISDDEEADIMECDKIEKSKHKAGQKNMHTNTHDSHTRLDSHNKISSRNDFASVGKENQKQARTSIESCIDKIANALSAKTSPSKTSPLEVESGKKRKSTSSENSFATSSSTSVGDKDSIEDDIERSSEMGHLAKKFSTLDSLPKKTCFANTGTHLSEGNKNYSSDFRRLTEGDRVMYQCRLDGCKSNFATKKACRQHEKDKHRIIIDKPCDLNDFASITVAKPVHEGPFYCKFDGCDGQFATESALNQHEWDKHRFAGEFFCAIKSCGKTFWSRQSLQTHTDSQHAEEPPFDYAAHKARNAFRCKIAGCEIDFGSQYYLAQHLWNKHKYGKHSCNNKGCGRSFMHFFTLRDHIRSEHNRFNENHSKENVSSSASERETSKSYTSLQRQLARTRVFEAAMSQINVAREKANRLSPSDVDTPAEKTSGAEKRDKRRERHEEESDDEKKSRQRQREETELIRELMKREKLREERAERKKREREREERMASTLVAFISDDWDEDERREAEKKKALPKETAQKG